MQRVGRVMVRLADLDRSRDQGSGLSGLRGHEWEGAYHDDKEKVLRDDHDIKFARFVQCSGILILPLVPKL